MMNAFLNPQNGTSVIHTIDITAHNISLVQEDNQPKNNNGICIPHRYRNIITD